MLKNFTVIELLSTRSNSVVNLKGNTFKFNPQTADELGYPQYVEFLVNMKEKQFAIRPSEKDKPNAVPFCQGKERKKVTVTNTVISGLIRKMAGWEQDCNFNMPGIYDSDENALAYSVKAAEVPQSKGGGWAVKRQREAEAASKATEKELVE